ncbi:MAG TPA: hypothetical protein VHZ55_29530 [Bryobacteraceae bacterium]|nr:hypothetical protein [Bryobacteraceae bacterium]
MKTVTKYSVEIRSPDAAGEVVTNAFRAAVIPRKGAAFISLPSDVADAHATAIAPPMLPLPGLGAAPESLIPKGCRSDFKRKMSCFALRNGRQRAPSNSSTPLVAG